MAEQQHGGALDRAMATYGGDRAQWLDLSTGINPNPYPLPEIPMDVWHRLPDEGLLVDCIAAAHAYYSVPNGGAIVAAPGTQALIQLMPKICGSDTVSVISPTYNEHANCWQQSGALVNNCDLASYRCDGSVVVVNPNNPNGNRYDRETLTKLASALGDNGHYLIVDEAFGDVDPDLSIVPHLTPNMIVLKSFGKFFGLAGARLGFAICAPTTADAIATQLGPWAASGPSLYLGAKAMRDADWISAARGRLSGKRQCVEDMLRTHEFDIVGATDLFITTSHVDSGRIANSLAEQYILVRSFEYAPTWIRFGLPATHSDFDRLQRALDKALTGL